jgi:hypothetical protein
MTSLLSKLRLVFALGVAATVTSSSAYASFLDRPDPIAVRVVTWNIYFDSVFADVNPARNQQFARVASALAPDVWAFQEMYSHSAAQVKSLLDAAQPLGTPGGWQVYKSGELAIASRYPIPAAYRATGNRALVNLPDDAYARDLYLMNAHFKCCGGFDNLRQQSSDQNINWMRDARTPGGAVTLPANTPMVVLGDLNIVEGLQPLTTLLDGDIQNSSIGPDSPPDWDGSHNVAVTALHNAVGPENYTWRDDRLEYDPGQLDFLLYTDSVMGLAHSFVLNTASMSEADRAAAGLQQYDTAIDSLTYDHLPVVADFVIPPPPIPGDFNGDRLVGAKDLAAWQTHFGASAGAALTQGDADADGDVDGSDLLTWQRHLTAPPAAAANVPEPSSVALAALMLLAALSIYRSSMTNAA